MVVGEGEEEPSLVGDYIERGHTHAHTHTHTAVPTSKIVLEWGGLFSLSMYVAAPDVCVCVWVGNYKAGAL